jgi:hypothetical protein
MQRIARRCRVRSRWFIHRTRTPEHSKVWHWLEQASIALSAEQQ